jgi:predicted ATPase/class 3 adenylate cyclase/DNA-binding CsgD family transcriptional regulator
MLKRFDLGGVEGAGGGLPAGTVTFVLGDVVGSTRLWEDHADAMPEALAKLDELIDTGVTAHGGARPAEQGEGDSFVAAFARAADAVRFSVALQTALGEDGWPDGTRVALRMALHTGDARVRDGSRYMGEALNRCARLRALGHPGQVLLSRATADLVVDHLSDGAFLRDLGIHHLRDLTRPERVAQLCAPGLPFDFPPLRSLERLPNNLPVQMTSFIGRTGELSETADLLAEHRMLTLTGSGGCGKTRLAVQLAAEVLDRFPGGVWLADLSPIADPELAGKAVAAAVGCPEVPGQTPTEITVEWLRDAEALVVIDNCEHLLDAAVDVAEALLAGCPGVRLLATSREPLGAAGETTYRVPSLPVPNGNGDAATDADCDSVRLFADRAAQARPSLRIGPTNLDAVATICTRLDGIPLAIELAAARCRVMSPAQIAQQLADRFSLLSGGRRGGLPRQRTLEASVDWSYALLSENERRLLRLLSVFAGGFTLDAVAACWETNGSDGWEAVDLLSGLVDKSLVQPPDDEAAEPRYRLLETIRQYAADKLTEAGEAPDARQRHAEFYAGLAETAVAGLTGPDILRCHATLMAELDNLRAADDWGAETGQADIALRLGGREVGTPYGALEGQQRLTRALALEGGPPSARVRALLGLGEMHFMLGDLEGLATLCVEAAGIATTIGDDELRGQALGARGWAAWLLGDDGAAALLSEAVALLRATGSHYWASDALWALGALAIAGGDATDAREHLGEAVNLTRSVGNPMGTGRSLVFLGLALMLEGDLDPAEAALVEARALIVECDDHLFLGIVDAGLSWIEAARGNAAAALRRNDAALADARRRHQVWSTAWLLYARASAEARSVQSDAGLCPSAEEAETATEAEGLAWAAVCCRAIRAEEQLATGDLAGAKALAASAVEQAENAPYARRSLGRALLALSRVTRAEGDPSAAEDVAHHALAALAAASMRLEVAEALELLGGLAAEQGSPAEAVRLLAAAEAARGEIGYPVPPAEAARLEEDLEQARAALDPAAFEAARAEGATMALDDAVAYASRGRGERKRPSSGWASLTPAEQDVVRLVAEGLRNADVAARLFVSPATVKTHLAHVFAKLGVSTRAELAGLAARRADGAGFRYRPNG